MRILFTLQILVLFPFRFTTEFGERDSYRMFLGLVDTLRTGAFFNSSLLYNREASFGYYSLLYALTPIIGTAPSALIAAVNWIGLLSVVLFVIPGYIVTERMFGSRVAVASGLVLAATPVWWHCGLYGHPITTSLLLFFTGLAILCRYSQRPTLYVRAVSLVFFALALMFRFDAVLLFIALLAVLWHVRQVAFRDVAKEAAFYIAGSLALFGLARQFLPPVSSGDAPASILALLIRFENTSHLLASVRDSVISLGQGFTPILLATIPVSMWMLWRKREYPLLLFVTGEIIVNLIFWLPNTVPPRHYLPMAPAISISTAIFVLGASRSLSLSGLRAGGAVAIAVVLTSLALNYGRSYLSYFPSQFTDQVKMKAKINEANHVADGLVSLPALRTPVIVLCDSNLVIAELEKRRRDTSAVYRTVATGGSLVGFHDVHQGNNRFVMIEQSWEPADIEAFDKSGQYAGVPVLAAPYLPIEYNGLRQRVAYQGPR